MDWKQKKKWIFSLLIGLLLVIPFDEVHAKKVLERVVIDAGHGGKDPGTLSRNRGHYNEKTIALRIALKLGKLIETNYKDVKVIYTRKKDRFISLKKRAEIANDANANLFISIHVDAVANKRVKGASVYVLGLHRSEDNLKVAMRENAVMLQEDDYKTQYAGFNPQDPESYIIFSLMQNQYLENSVMMANLVNDFLHKKTQRYTKGVKQAGFYVLREVAMPSVLIETGYITNYTDAKYLCSTFGQNKTANAIFGAFKAYKNYLENNTVSLNEKTEPDDVEDMDTMDTFYTVQLLYSQNKRDLNKPPFKNLKKIFVYKEPYAYRYVYGKTTSYEEALKLQKEARVYVQDAYIVGIHKGEKVDKKQVQSILGKEK